MIERSNKTKFLLKKQFKFSYFGVRDKSKQIPYLFHLNQNSTFVYLRLWIKRHKRNFNVVYLKTAIYATKFFLKLLRSVLVVGESYITLIFTHIHMCNISVFKLNPCFESSVYVLINKIKRELSELQYISKTISGHEVFN